MQGWNMVRLSASDQAMNRAGMEKLRPGDIMFSNTAGAVGVFITFAQWLLTKTEPGEFDIDHVGVVVSGGADWPRIVQAEPKGAECVSLDPAKHWTGHQIYVRPDYSFPLDQAERTAMAAMDYVGTPYSFADYAAILGLHSGIKNGPIRRYVTSSKHMICSQLADQALSDAGLHVFTDGRLPQDVMPVELFRALVARKGTMIFRPGWTDWKSPPKL